VCTPLGADLEAFWSGLVTGSSGISAIERFPVHDLRVRRGGEIKKLVPTRQARPPACRATRLLLAAAEDLTSRATMDVPPERLGVVVGTALGGVEELEGALGGDRGARRAAAALYDSPGRALARRLDARGPVITVSTACAASATALGVAADLLRADTVDLVVAGGYDALSRFVLRGFDSLRSLTREQMRPFDRRRSGLLLGEGAALLLLARDRDARGGRLGRLLGHASASDGSHLTAPDPDGRGLQLAIREALREAGVAPRELQFVSAHGTATPLGDRIEAAVLGRVVGGHVAVNSIKGAFGHTMGAAAALEAVMCLLAARDGIVPATAGLEDPDPECPLDCVTGAPRALRPRLSLSTSLGFGGCNAALVLEGGDASP
jgi:3-oxoacyl-(acyl-carrier-protein) synthase